MHAVSPYEALCRAVVSQAEKSVLAQANPQEILCRVVLAILEQRDRKVPG